MWKHPQALVFTLNKGSEVDFEKMEDAILEEYGSDADLNVVPLSISITDSFYTPVWLDDVISLARNLAIIAPNSEFVMHGRIDEDDEKGHYMDFNIEYKKNTLTVYNSDWYTFVEKGCGAMDDDPELYLVERFAGNHDFDELLPEVPLDNVTVFDINDSIFEEY